MLDFYRNIHLQRLQSGSQFQVFQVAISHFKMIVFFIVTGIVKGFAKMIFALIILVQV